MLEYFHLILQVFLYLFSIFQNHIRPNIFNVYYLTRGFIASGHAFNLITRVFDLLTRAFSLQTCAFDLPSRAFSLLTCGFELVTHRFEVETSRFELVTPISELVTRNSYFTFPRLNYFHGIIHFFIRNY